MTQRIAAAGITLEVCPSSNVALGVAATAADVPLRALLDAGVQVALGADDPLLFGPRLTAQYQIARQAHGLSDAELAELARMSVRASRGARRYPLPGAGQDRRLALVPGRAPAARAERGGPRVRGRPRTRDNGAARPGTWPPSGSAVLMIRCTT